MAYVTAESRKVETIEAFHSLCQSELTNAKECIETYKIKANEMYNLAKSSICGAQINAEDIDVYDTALTNMFQIIDVLERFNDKSKSILPQSFGSQVKEERKREKFTYIKPDLSKYAENSTINCVVAYIDPKDKLEFYINIPGNTDFEQFLDRYSNFLTEKIEELTTIPEEGDVFGLNLENCFFRAVRQNDLIEEEPVYPFKAYLIDTGESTLITKDTIKYVIEPQYRKIPAQAIPCILLSVNSNNNINERKIYMADQLYKTQNITVLARDSRTLYVNINAIETANANGAKQESDAISAHMDRLRSRLLYLKLTQNTPPEYKKDDKEPQVTATSEGVPTKHIRILKEIVMTPQQHVNGFTTNDIHLFVSDSIHSTSYEELIVPWEAIKRSKKRKQRLTTRDGTRINVKLVANGVVKVDQRPK